MNLATAKWIGAPSRGAWIVTVIFALAMAVSGASHAQAQDDDARKILKAMSDYVASQKTISATFDADIEVITTNLQKIQFTNSGQLHQLVDKMRDEFNVAVPGADLLLARVYDQLMEDVLDAKHIGRGVIDGVECEHLAFRNEDTDWQIWVEIGPRPIPRKYVITSKGVASGPQYTLRIKNWTTDASISADAFTFKAPAGAKKVDVKELQDIDEVPSGIIAGGRK